MKTRLCFASLIVIASPTFVIAQGRPRTPRADSLREASRLDTDGSSDKARAIFQKLVESAPDPLSKAQAQRALAISYAFTGDCANGVKAEDAVIAYWKTRESAEPQNAFFQEGEVANEAARICIDAGGLNTAEEYYRLGRDRGLLEPEPKTHPKSLWEYRYAHALARLAARRGNRQEALKQVADARKILDGDPAMADAQERYYPYLVGYVALYTGDFKVAEAENSNAIAVKGNEGDAFMTTLLAMTFEKMGKTDSAKEYYQKAYDLATGHNCPAAFARPYARKKLAP